MYIFEKNEPVQSEVIRVMQERIADSLAYLDTVDADPVTTVHEIRKNMKRIRALLRLVRPAMGNAKYRLENYRFRDIGRLLSDLRDQAVIVETLRIVFPATDEEPVPDALASLEKALEDARRRAYSDFMADAGLQQEVRSELASAQAWWEEGAFEITGKTLEKGMRRVFLRAQAGFHSLSKGQVSAEDFHEWRKQIKYLWYQHELFSARMAADAAFEERTARLDHLSDLLGLAHDAAVLVKMLQAELSESDGRALHRKVRYFRLDNEAAALAHGACLFRG